LHANSSLISNYSAGWGGLAAVRRQVRPLAGEFAGFGVRGGIVGFVGFQSDFPPPGRAPAEDWRAYARSLEEDLQDAVQGFGEELLRQDARFQAREDALRAEIEAQRARADALARRVEELAGLLGKDSSNSSKPPSSDSPYRKKPEDRSLRGKPGRRPGKQPGAPSSTLRQVPDPDEDIACPPAQCGACGAGLGGEPVLAERKRQVFDLPEPPRPAVTQYRLQKKACPCCGSLTEGDAPGGVTGRVQYGPRALALAAFLTCWHHVPVLRSAQLAASLSGLALSPGFAAGARGRAAARLGPFAARVRDLLAGAPVLHADETPSRIAGELRYLHVACTPYLTAMHAGDRTAAAIEAGGILGNCTGILVRDGYSGYSRLAAAGYAWCGAHLLRDLKAVCDQDPEGQAWAQDMAGILRDALAATARAREAGKTALPEDEQDAIRARYRTALAGGAAACSPARTAAARAGRPLVRRFDLHETAILRFVTDLDVPFTNNQAERDLRPVKVQQRASGAWRTLLGFADFAVVRSYLSTAAKWGIDPLDALTRLFTDGPWLPPDLEPG
jgi:transposase